MNGMAATSTMTTAMTDTVTDLTGKVPPAPVRLPVADGVHLNLQQWGEGSPVVMCHGLLFGSMAAWYFSTALPLSAGHQVVLYDMRGHGKSDWAVSGYDLATQMQDLDLVIHHAAENRSNGRENPQSEPVTLVGHSYGAMIALAYALAHPERVRRLVLVDAPHPLSLHVRPGLEAVSSREALLQRFARDLAVPGRRAERLRQRLEFLLFESTLRRDVQSSADFCNEHLGRLNVPTLCIYGEQSECREAGVSLSHTLPNAALAWVNCGHYVTDDAPADMLALIQAFISD
jgi:pimeloyl-ACP methyl ester carboxylesterase